MEEDVIDVERKYRSTSSERALHRFTLAKTQLEQVIKEMAYKTWMAAQTKIYEQGDKTSKLTH